MKLVRFQRDIYFNLKESYFCAALLINKKSYYHSLKLYCTNKSRTKNKSK